MDASRGADPTFPDERTRELFRPLAADPQETVVVTDFDGTLSPLVDDPSSARPLDGVVSVLARLVGSFATVAVVSGRPVSFLDDRLGTGPHGPPRAGGPRLIGLYGMESLDPDGGVVVDESAAAWVPVVGDVGESLRGDAPDGVLVEVKHTAVTVHWRRAPGAGDWAAARVGEEVARSGLVAHPGRESIELRPPIAIDKGTTVRSLATGHRGVCFLGDDIGDLPAFAELLRLRSEGVATVGVAVIDDDTAPEVVVAADASVAGPREGLALLEWLADAAGAPQA